VKNLGLLLLRLTVGPLLAAHGAQKLFGSFSGPGLKGTSGFMETLGMRPGSMWGPMAGMAEFAGGILTALGFLNPIGPLNIMAAMAVATRKAHWKLPVFVSSGGAELAATNLAAAAAIATAGPGAYSLDRLFGIRLPRWMTVMVTATMALMVYLATERPDVVENVVNTASSAVTGNTGGAPTQTPMDSDLEVETRPRQEEPHPAPTS
jgi:putative oxidoreductase